MKLPVLPPVRPMLAKSISGVPAADGLIYEPKWDGFRCIVFRDGDEVELGSRNERPLTRYFPELVESLKANLPERCVIDGEIVVVTDKGLDFETLQLRVHPAASRVRMLSETIPASFVAFDLLALGDDNYCDRPFSDRRASLEEALSGARPPIYLTPTTTDHAEAERWFGEFEGAGLDGVVAKDTAMPYQPDKRVMFKIKHERTVDCVVVGFRWHKSGPVVGSLLLGLYDTEGRLHHVGVTASFTMVRRRELVDELSSYRMNASETHPWQGEVADGDRTRRPGAPSRWNPKGESTFEPLRPELVCEVAYDHMQGDRFRHATTFRRWRADRTPESCSYEQVETVIPLAVNEIFGLPQ